MAYSDINYRIILVHGFFKTYKDMEKLEEYLTNIGYKVDNLNFPLTFPKMEMSVEILKAYLLNLKKNRLNEKEEIIIIGQGFGGMLIKKTLKDISTKGIVDKIILIASPIHDSTLHRRLKRVFPFMDLIFKPLAIYGKEKNYVDNFDSKIEIGLIIGTESEGFFGKWLGDFNDGYVALKDTVLPEASDIVQIPITHAEIHQKIGTARYINNFIMKGKFRLE